MRPGRRGCPGLALCERLSASLEARQVGRLRRVLVRHKATVVHQLLEKRHQQRGQGWTARRMVAGTEG